MDRQRWQANVKSMEIVAKPREEITQEDVNFLRENYTSMGGLLPKGFNGGAFFTPTHVAKFLVEFLNIPIGSKILEPSVGSGVFLEHLPDGCEITALELDETSAKVTSLIYPQADVIIGNALEHKRRNYYDYVIGNPPYGESIEVDAEDADYETLTKSKGTLKGKSENAFIELAIKAVKPGGYIAFILPMGISFGQGSQKVRQLMYDTCWHVATIKLPGTTFQHVGTSIPTQILIMRKVTPGIKRRKSDDIDADFFEGQQPVFMADITDIGYDKHGKSTDKYGDGLTQLDELLELAQIGGWQTELVRENLYPHEPSWICRNSDVTSYMFWQEGSAGHSDAKRYGGPHHWHEMTLGVNGDPDNRSWDFGWQDEIVEAFNAIGRR